MNSPLLALLAVALVSLPSALGYFLAGRWLERHGQAVFFLVALAVGTLVGDVFFHLLPEVWSAPELHTTAPWLILAGFLGFFVMEKFIRWRHCHLPERRGKHVHPVVAMTVVGDLLHNLVDGLMIGAAFQLGSGVGLATALAVFAHEVPQELGDYGILVAGDFSPRKALAANLLSAASAFLGLGLAWLAFRLSPAASLGIAAATAGGFLYIAGSDLVPELHHELDPRRSALQLGGIALGVACMASLKAWLG